MTAKNILRTVACFVMAMPSCVKTIAQQNRNAATNNLFIQLPRPDNPVTQSMTASGPTSQLISRSPNRSFDGTNNNISNSQKLLYGSANIQLYREIPAAYGPADPRNALNGTTRPSPRKISNVVIDEPVTHFSERELSAFVYVWGQFIDHDMTLTPTGTTEQAPISLPPDEVVFTEEIPFTRSEVRPGTGVSNARQQTNLNTSWIDGSVVYGSDATRAGWLRTHVNGKMKTSTGNFLPWNTVTGQQADAIDPASPMMANDNGHTVKTFVAGDIRAAEHPGILSLHTLFVREHNRICDRLYAQGWRKDEDMYQRARKEVGALIQAITFQEFLPAIGISLKPYYGYNSNVRPDIANTFATASYRIGHTMVADDIMMLSNSCTGVGPVVLDLIEAFWIPELVPTYNVDPFLKGLAAHTQYETDTRINSILRNFLFGSPNDPVRFGIDLGSLNIQRGRDHGMPDYNTARKYYTGKAATKFSDITSNQALADSLQMLYGNVNNVDLWIGILAEDHMPGKSVGKTMHAMLKWQFENLRDGDYYYYKYDPYLPLLTKLQISATRLSDVIKRNSSLTNLQSNVFFTVECPGFPSEEGENRMASAKRNAAFSFENALSSTEVKIYPNPVSDVLTIDVGKINNPYSIKLLSANGTVMKTLEGREKKLTVNVAGFSKGMYFINISSGNTVKTYRFVKL